MRKLILILILIVGCISKTANKEATVSNKESEKRNFLFDFITPKTEFDLTITEFYENKTSCATEVIPYALIIGITSEKNLPKKVSVLSVCEERIFKLGQKIKIIPESEPSLLSGKNPLYPLYFVVVDTIVNGKNKTDWIVGSENKAVWGYPKTK